MLLALAVLAAAQDVPPPRTVNGEILGTAEEFRVSGPARVCLMGTAIDLLPGENAYLDYLGIHWGAIRVIGPHGEFRVREGATIEPRGGQLSEDWRGRTIARFRDHGRRPKYLLFATAADEPWYEYPQTWIEGDALGRSRDRAILRRVRTDEEAMAGCQRRFVYGRDMILGTPGEE